MPETPSLPPRYVDLTLIGSGGMGDVYRARDTSLDRPVAIKVLRHVEGGGGELRRRFAREGRAAARITHPNVVVIHDVGEHDGHAFIVMELMEGGSVGERLMKGRVPTAEAVSWITQAAAGLDAASWRCLTSSSRPHGPPGRAARLAAGALLKSAPSSARKETDRVAENRQR